MRTVTSQPGTNLMTLRRGFKKEAAELAGDVRGELRLNPFARLDPYRLARHLNLNPPMGLVVGGGLMRWCASLTWENS